MTSHRRVKIVATIGPSTFDETVLADLIAAGADVLRINMSHTSHDLLDQTVARIRRVEARAGRPVGILVDLQGPKLRVGTFREGTVDLEAGQRFVLDGTGEPGTAQRVHLPHPEIIAHAHPGDRLLLDDGKVSLRVIQRRDGALETEVIHGGRLSNNKGIALPDTVLPTSPLTDKDRADLAAALRHDIDWIALSFVQRPQDMTEMRRLVGDRAGIMAKIEKPQALEHLDAIIAESDAIMVARGDLGVELPLEVVPGLQKRITRRARHFGKPVVVATQMLESMINAPVPTRAEVSDVSIAVFEGADAIMLSAESATGHYPLEAVRTMDRVARTVEQDENYPAIIRTARAEPEPTPADAIAAAARQMAETLDLAALVAHTSSGFTALRAARERPMKPILALAADLAVVRRLTLAWGVHCLRIEPVSELDSMIEQGCEKSVATGLAKRGDAVAVISGLPIGVSGTTNMIRIARIPDNVVPLAR